MQIFITINIKNVSPTPPTFSDASYASRPSSIHSRIDNIWILSKAITNCWLHNHLLLCHNISNLWASLWSLNNHLSEYLRTTWGHNLYLLWECNLLNLLSYRLAWLKTNTFVYFIYLLFVHPWREVFTLFAWNFWCLSWFAWTYLTFLVLWFLVLSNLQSFLRIEARCWCQILRI